MKAEDEADDQKAEVEGKAAETAADKPTEAKGSDGKDDSDPMSKPPFGTEVRGCSRCALCRVQPISRRLSGCPVTAPADMSPDFTADMSPDFPADMSLDFPADMSPDFPADMSPDFPADMSPDFPADMSPDFPVTAPADVREESPAGNLALPNAPTCLLSAQLHPDRFVSALCEYQGPTAACFPSNPFVVRGVVSAWATLSTSAS